ncbi:MAG: ABC transporter permease [Nocardioides sp.]|jgi:ABC-2 type transport system permease protein
MTALNQGWLVARREMRERARSRSFRVSTLLMLIVVVAAVVLPGLLDDGNTTRHVGVSGTTAPAFEQVLSGQTSDDTTIHLHTYDELAAGEEALRDERIDLLVVDGRLLEWRGRPDAELQALVTGALQVATVQQRAAASGLDPDTVARLLSPVRVESLQIGSMPGRSADDDSVAFVMSVVLLTAILIYGNLVLTGVVEEKSSRVVEVLLARVPAKALLGGKVVGIGLLGLGQLAVTALAALIASAAVDSVDLPAVTGSVLAWVLVWFVLGYALYAMVYGALGSLATRTEDAQAVAGPVGYVLIAGYWAAFMAIGEDPEGMWARVLSLFPATAPLAMPGRIALQATDWWEAPLAVLLTLAALAGLVAFAGRVYGNAVLRTGATLRLRDAWHSRQNEPREARTSLAQTMTSSFASPQATVIGTAALAAAGIVAAAVVFALTGDVIWSAVPALLAVAAVRRVRQHR